MKKTTVRLSAADYAAIDYIKASLGIDSSSAVIRLAIRVLLQALKRLTKS